ncbi:2TM domain-containing protein [Lutimonas zeaxanthinifaciens]|uniref:2TM domain-containing protein n=1 Tax=Lutimonas zeaxanthinifaciens TaxID=3060215 RepID=UPI00265D3D21|nr:2TM domain-containing protein [Lutimonas sp. YSD2104]WKK67230.1 histidine kinase [Lutimonas sp. YSD2104]
MNKTTKNIIILFSIGTIIFILGSGYFNQFQYEGFNDAVQQFLIFQLYAFVLGGLNMYFFNYLESRNWAEGTALLRVLVGLLGSFVITVIGLFIVRMSIALLFENQSISEYLASEQIGNFKFGIWSTLTVVVIFHVIYFYNKYQKKKVKESQIVAKNQTARFESLKNQLDPHFLFNSLNVLTSLIGENPGQAEKFTTKLSKVYRYVLEQKNKDLTSVTEELRFAKSYMELLRMRFEDAVDYEIPQEVSDPELKIIPLSLQLLLENAVKHNVITTEQPLKIKIYEDRGYLIVENTVNPKTSLEKSTKVGLNNIKQRYELVSSNKVSIENNNKIFKVKLPLLNQKIKVMRTEYMDESAKYLRAKKKVDDLKGFYGSLVAYFIVIPFLIFLNYKTSWQFQWFWFPMLGWGLGLILQAFTVFGMRGNWEERKIREIMEKNRKY